MFSSWVKTPQLMNASHIITQATHYKTRFVMNRVVFIWAIMNLPKCQILKLMGMDPKKGRAHL